MKQQRQLKTILSLVLVLFLVSCGGQTINEDSDLESGDITPGGHVRVEDTTPPQVSSVDPTSDATAVSLDTTVTAAFNEAMDSSTITTSSFTLADTSSSITGTVTYANSTATFTPSANLAENTEYTASISASVTDTSGNPLDTAFSWSFTTGTTASGDGDSSTDSSTDSDSDSNSDSESNSDSSSSSSTNLTSEFDLTSGLIAYYKFSGNVEDDTTNDHDGTLIDGTLTFDRIGNEDSAYDFDGVNDYITMNSLSDEFEDGDVFSYSSWIKTDSISDGGTIFGVNAPDYPDNAKEGVMKIFLANTGIRVCASGYPDSVTQCSLFDVNYSDGIWHFITVTIDADGNKKGYFDNIELEDIENDSVEYVQWTAATRFSIGQEWDSYDASDFFPGKIDNVRIYKRLLNREEIESLYALESGMVLLDSGQFEMGDNTGNGVDTGDGEDDELPVHTVELSEFYISDHEVTATEYKECVDAGSCSYTGGTGSNYTYGASGKENHPINYVSWTDAQDYIVWKNKNSGITFRLCSEAEWEYAGRAGTTTKHSCGDADSCLDDIAWYSSNSSNTTHSVKIKNSNAWGLYDFQGNVWEWLQDWYHSDYIGAPTDGSAWVSPEGTLRGFKGGSLGSTADGVRIARRGGLNPTTQGAGTGFRICGIKSRLPDSGQITSYTTTFGEDSDYSINLPSFTDNGDGTVTDNITGLMWQQEDDNTERNWAVAGTYCDDLNFAGQTDWRLPNDREVISIINSELLSLGPNFMAFRSGSKR